ncbi:unnamed protein product [Merluccius merluccius]
MRWRLPLIGEGQGAVCGAVPRPRQQRGRILERVTKTQAAARANAERVTSGCVTETQAAARANAERVTSGCVTETQAAARANTGAGHQDPGSEGEC